MAGMTPPDDAMLEQLARLTGEALATQGVMLATAESCTGGWVGQVLTAIPGSSAWYERGFITYSNPAKQVMLGVSPATLLAFGAVSEATAQEMALGAITHSRAQAALSITGIAGPGGGSAHKPVGMVCFGWALDDSVHSATCHFTGDRASIRRQAVAHALTGLIERLKQRSLPA
jgi:nicotinamide-nucleotide amidase